MAQTFMYSDQKVGFEIEMSRFEIVGKVDNKEDIVTFYKGRISDDNYFFKIVTEGQKTTHRTYLEIVSKEYCTDEDIIKFMKVIYAIGELSKKSIGEKPIEDFINKLKQDLQPMGLVNGEIDKKFKNMKINISTSAPTYANSIHINVDLPFRKICGLAKCGLLPSEGKIAIAPFAYACNEVNNNFQAHSSGVKSLLTLFFYQHAVYMAAPADYTTCIRNINLPYKSNANKKAEDGKKYDFNVLFKVSKADIIDKVLNSKELLELLSKEYVTQAENNDNNINFLNYDEVKKVLERTRTQTGYQANISSGFYDVLKSNAQRKKQGATEYFYDEPRISGLILPKVSDAVRDHYVVAEIRNNDGLANPINRKLKTIIDAHNRDRKAYEEEIKGFIGEFKKIINQVDGYTFLKNKGK